MFELSYYLHHDGPLSSDPSDEVKATVLAGSPFLFKAYELLAREQQAREQEPSFFDKMTVEVNTVVAATKDGGSRVLETLRGEKTEQAPSPVEPGTDNDETDPVAGASGEPVASAPGSPVASAPGEPVAE
jgi:hypothetical protein